MTTLKVVQEVKYWPPSTLSIIVVWVIVSVIVTLPIGVLSCMQCNSILSTIHIIDSFKPSVYRHEKARWRRLKDNRLTIVEAHFLPYAVFDVNIFSRFWDIFHLNKLRGWYIFNYQTNSGIWKFYSRGVELSLSKKTWTKSFLWTNCPLDFPRNLPGKLAL